VSQQEHVSFRRGFVTADFLTNEYRISGEVSIRLRPLSDSLNDVTTDYLEIENIYVSPIQQPADIKAHYQYGSLSKENIVMVILARLEDGLSRSSSYGDYVGHIVHDVFLTVPSFEVRGSLATRGKIGLRDYMAMQAERFIPIAEATATVSLAPNIRFQGGMLLVNKSHIGIICMSGEE
jgi:hypothetical protein